MRKQKFVLSRHQLFKLRPCDTRRVLIDVAVPFLFPFQNNPGIAVIVDTDFLIENINSSNVLVKGNACEIIPLDYVSNRVSHVSLYSVSSRKDKQTELLNFAAQEIEVLQKIAFAKETETTVKTPATLETEEKWVLRLHVKDMENLYYYAADRLCRTTEGAWYFMATANDVRCAVPAGIAEKFEMAVQRI